MLTRLDLGRLLNSVDSTLASQTDKAALYHLTAASPCYDRLRVAAGLAGKVHYKTLQHSPGEGSLWTEDELRKKKRIENEHNQRLAEWKTELIFHIKQVQTLDQLKKNKKCYSQIYYFFSNYIYGLVQILFFYLILI